MARELTWDTDGTMAPSAAGLPTLAAMDLMGSMGEDVALADTVTATWSVTGCVESLLRTKGISK